MRLSIRNVDIDYNFLPQILEIARIYFGGDSKYTVLTWDFPENKNSHLISTN
jgi:hypothetical protein